MMQHDTEKRYSVCNKYLTRDGLIDMVRRALSAQALRRIQHERHRHPEVQEKYQECVIVG